jgi:hypothetical protein
VIVVGVIAYHSAAAGRAEGAPADAVVTAAFETAARTWRRHIDWPPVHRLVLTSAEEYGTGNYVFVFDAYNWFGISTGYATACSERSDIEARVNSCGGGGVLRHGGFAGFGGHVTPNPGLTEARAGLARRYGPGRVVAPSTP